MKKLFVIAVLIISLALSLILFGCGEQEQPAKEEVPEVTADTTATVPAAADTIAPAPEAPEEN